MLKKTFDKVTRTTKNVQLDNSEIFNIFKNVNMKANLLKNKKRAVSVSTSSSDYVIEIINVDKKIVFLKIGQQNPSSTVALRDVETLDSEDVPMSDTQLLELFTYCLIDFENCIISYIGLNGAPKISAITSFFEKYIEEDISVKLNSIMTEDILKTIMKKSTISKLEVDVAVPSDEVLSNSLGIDAKTFDRLQNIKTSKIKITVVGERNKNIFKASDQLGKYINELQLKLGNRLVGISANAKDINEDIQTYNLLQYNFTKKVALGNNYNNIISESEFKNALMRTYITNKEELEIYTR